MTKSIRIENADTSNHKVRVTSQTKNAEGVWVDDTGGAIALDYPTAMCTQTIWQGKRIVIEEAQP